MRLRKKIKKMKEPILSEDEIKELWRAEWRERARNYRVTHRDAFNTYHRNAARARKEARHGTLNGNIPRGSAA